MLVQRIIIRQYDWAVTILYNCDCSNIFDIIDHLKSINCSDKYIQNAIDNLSKCKKDTGLTYSNYSLNRSIMIINSATSKQEFINTIVHESFHLIATLYKKFNIDDEETLASLIGNFVMNTYEVVKDIEFTVN